MFNKEKIILFVVGLMIFYYILIQYFSNKKLIKIKEQFVNNELSNTSESSESCLYKDDETKITYIKSNLENLTETENIFFEHNFSNDKIKGCKQNKIPTIIDKNILRYPIQIILYKYVTKNVESTIDNYIYLGLFNDGGIYSKNNIKQTHWDGPLVNSLVEENGNLKSLRNICLSKEGELLGITFDGNVYIKNLISDNKLRPYEMPWKKWDVEMSNVKYLMFNENEDYYIITKNSKLLINKKPKVLKTTDGILVNVNKIYKDYNNYLLVLDNDNKLYKSVNINYNIVNSNTIELMDEFSSTELVDIIYDNDKTLIGLGIPEKGLKNNETKLLQQKKQFFLSNFFLIENVSNNLQKELSKNNIIRFKNNINVEKKEELITLEELYTNEKNNDQKEFRKFCSEKFSNTKVNLQIENEIKINNEKLENLSKTINNLKQDTFNN
jgi:hypothetical protein